jgi:hypothetical protein
VEFVAPSFLRPGKYVVDDVIVEVFKRPPSPTLKMIAYREGYYGLKIPITDPLELAFISMRLERSLFG